MRRADTPMEVAIKGALAGLAGTVVLTVAMRFAGRHGEDAPAMAEVATRGEAPASPPARLVGKVASGVFERELSPNLQDALGHGVHWGYGALWGMIYGLVQASIRFPHLLHGAVLGLIVWLVGPRGLVPAMNLSTGTDDEAPRSARSFVLHEVYGWAVALVFAGLSRDG
jgi:hypothetical protein